MAFKYEPLLLDGLNALNLLPLRGDALVGEELRHEDGSEGVGEGALEDAGEAEPPRRL